MDSTITKLLNEHELANLLAVSVATLRRWRLLKRGPQFTKLGASVRYRPEDVANWLASQPKGGASASTAPLTTSTSRDENTGATVSKRSTRGK